MALEESFKRFPTAARFDRRKLVTQQDIVASGTSNEFGTEQFDFVTAFLKVGTATGTSPTLDVRLQTSYDGGVTWVDVAASAQITTSNDEGNHVIQNYPFDADGGGDVAAVTTDGSLTAATYKTWRLGSRCRLKWTIGGSDTPTIPLEVWITCKR